MYFSINDGIDTWCSKYDIDKSVLMEWKGKVINKIDEKTKNFVQQTIFKISYECTLVKQSVKYFE